MKINHLPRALRENLGAIGCKKFKACRELPHNFRRGNPKGNSESTSCSTSAFLSARELAVKERGRLPNARQTIS